MEDVGSLPLRMEGVGKLSTPWIDRICLIFTLCLCYLISPYFSELIQNYTGVYSNLISLSVLILISPLVGNFISLRIINYFIFK
jgi:hypothetical protein